MKDNENYRQVLLFEKLQKVALTHQKAFVNQVCDLLGLKIDAAYRRMRGETTISFDHVVKLCKHFHLPLETFLSDVDNNQFQCILVPENINNIDNYVSFTKDFSASLEKSRSQPGSEIILSAADIPVFHFLAFKELAFFQLFSWNKKINTLPEKYETFAEQLNTTDLSTCYQQIVTNYQHIPTTEIWTPNTIDSILQLIRYHALLNHFTDKKTPLLFCRQLMELMESLMQRLVKSAKNQNDTRFDLYINEVDVGNTIILFKNEEQTTCLLRLFTINGLSVSNERFCQTVDHWLHHLTLQSTLLSGSSEIERFKFFDVQKRKIKTLMDSL